MIEWFIVIVFWWNGQLVKQTSQPIPTQAECERLLPGDVAQRVEAHGNGVGYCFATPPRPADARPPKTGREA